MYGDTNKGGQKGLIYDTQGIMSCLTSTDYKQPKQIKVNSATSKGYEEAGVGDSINLSVPTSKTRRGRVGKGVAQTLDTHCNQAVIGYSRDSKGVVVNYHEKDECNTLHLASGGGGNTDQFIKQNKIRRLTPIECERLQGFPDNWTKYGQSGEISDSQRYKMCGNAVTVDVVEAVAKNIKQTVYGKETEESGH